MPEDAGYPNKSGMNLVLIGYRGTGKSAVAGGVAWLAGLTRVGMDAELVRQFGCTIPEFVEQHGWTAFRDAETALLAKLAEQTGQLIDCGGGVVVREENRRRLRKMGLVVWLRASSATIAERINEDTQRPSLTGTKSFLEEIDEVLAERMNAYREAATLAIDTDQAAIEDLIQLIFIAWKDYQQKSSNANP